MKQNSHSPLSTSHQTRKRLQRRVARLGKTHERWVHRLHRLQSTRLTVALVFIAGLVIATAQPRWQIEIPLVVLFLLSFPWLVLQTRRVARHVERLNRLQTFNERQLKRVLGEPSGRDWERAKTASADLRFHHDLGMISAHSLWTLIDETITDGGERRLLQWMSQETCQEASRNIEQGVSTEPTTEATKTLSAEAIVNKQKKLKSLRPLTWFYTRLTLISVGDQFRLSTAQILDFIRHPFLPDSYNKLFALTLGLWTLFVANLILRFNFGWGWPVPSLILFTAVHFWVLSRAGSTFKKGVGLSHHLSELSPIFARLEAKAAHDTRLRELMPKTAAHGPSIESRRINRILGFLGVEANPLLHLLVNAFLPWSSTGSFFLEKRRAQIGALFPHCLDELAEFEAYGSLLILDRYQTQNYPEISTTQASLSFRSLFHPLLNRDRVVANDFDLGPDLNHKTLGLLTGSNMSGKSTLLRTIGLNQVLANMGAPVFADHLLTSPFAIETCIEVSDSLRDGYSYFYAEVRRLKGILIAATKDATNARPVLFLVDEIFRGTNNRERQIGSQAIIRQLAEAPHAIGFVSTHDLELTALETQVPSVLNLHFREHIENGRMVFSYKLHHGACPTTNALRIMEAEGIELGQGS